MLSFWSHFTVLRTQGANARQQKEFVFDRIYKMDRMNGSRPAPPRARRSCRKERARARSRGSRGPQPIRPNIGTCCSSMSLKVGKSVVVGSAPESAGQAARPTQTVDAASNFPTRHRDFL